MPIREPRQRLHVVIQGRVQGVGFRMFVLDKARSLQLTGWTRNRRNGDVEVLAEGTRPMLETFLTHLRSGPPVAKVIHLDLEWGEASDEFQRFDVRSSA